MAYTRMNLVRPVAIGFMTDTMGRMHSDAQFAGRHSASVTTLWLLVRLTLLLRSTNKFVSLVASKEYARLTAGLFLCSYLRGTECTFPMKLLAAPLNFRVPSAFSRQIARGTLSNILWTTCFQSVLDDRLLNKTFGRQVYNMNSENSELALVKLMELFNHSSVAITKNTWV